MSRTFALLARYVFQNPGETSTQSNRQTGIENTIEEWLTKKYEGVLLRIERVRKEDLKMVCAFCLSDTSLTIPSPTIFSVIHGSI
jgi:hypothetical protein